MTTDAGKNPESIRPAKGVHLTVPWSLVRNDIAVVIPVPGDKRSLFLIPWISNYDGTFQYTYVGTTDTDYQGSIDDPHCTRIDIDYVLKALNAAVPKAWRLYKPAGGNVVDIGGYFMLDDKKANAAMRPCPAFNKLIDSE